jgi:hypothetical protein
MADFIAVIRRAVDGLTDNTPEMRVKVYERARGAVQRQLENMKPRPPEAMLQRQLEKLEAAIREVESEHAAHEEPVAAEAAQVEPPVYEEPEPYQEPAAYQEPDQDQEPTPYHDVQAEAAAEPPAQQDEPWTAPEPVAHVDPEPVEPWQVPHYGEAPRDERLHDLSPEPVAEPYFEPVEAAEEPVEEAEPVAQPVARDFDLSNRLVEPVYAFEQAPKEFVEHSRDEPLHADAAAHFDPVWSEPAETVPEPASKIAPTDWALEELRQFSETEQAAPANDAARAFEDVISGIENPPEPAKMPAANEGFSWEAAAFDDLPPIDSERKVSVHARFDDSDLFSEVHGTSSPKAEAAAAAASNDAWQEATQLRGYDNRGVVAEDDDGSADVDSAIASKFQGKNFRMEPKRRRFGLGSIFGVLLALGVVGGGAYAAWTNQGALVDMVKGLVSAAPSQTAKTDPQAPVKPDAAAPASQAGDPANATKPAEGQKELASPERRLRRKQQVHPAAACRWFGSRQRPGCRCKCPDRRRKIGCRAERRVGRGAYCDDARCSACRCRTGHAGARDGRAGRDAGRLKRKVVPLRRAHRTELADGDRGFGCLEPSARVGTGRKAAGRGAGYGHGSRAQSDGSA